MEEYKHPFLYDFFYGRSTRFFAREATKVAKIGSNTKVLDVMCGTGEQALLYATQYDAHVTGLDLSDKMVEQAKKKLSPIKSARLIRGDATNMPFFDKEFDIAAICLGLHALEEAIQVAVINEMRRVAKDRIVLVDYTVPPKQTPSSPFYKLLIFGIERFATIKNPFTESEHYRNYREFLKRGGLHGLLSRLDIPVEREKRTYGGQISIVTIKS